jgi:DNA-binding NarL/FixJ family response regulator
MGKINAARVLIIDDHPILREGLAQLINQQKDLTMGGQAGTSLEALQLIEKEKFDLVILDISLHGCSGIELLKDIKARKPALPVLILSMHDENIYAPRALKAGAIGYIMKQEGPDAVLHCVRSALNGNVCVSRGLQGKLLNQMAGGKPTLSSPVEALSDRELEIFNLIGQGFGTRDIAVKLNLSIKTVETHRAHIKEKLGLKTATELVHQAIQWTQSQPEVQT